MRERVVPLEGESMTILIRQRAIHRLGDVRCDSQGSLIAIQGSSFGFALSCFVPASFESE